MVVKERLQAAINNAISKAGTEILIKYYTATIGSVWDDEATYSQSGTDLWASAVVMPIRGIRGSNEAILIEQGKLSSNDKKVYVNGSIAFTGSEHTVSVQIGSPNGDLYGVIDAGTETWDAEGVSVYSKQYLSRITGSVL